MSYGSFPFVCFILTCPGGRRLHYDASRVSSCSLGFVCFIRARPGVIGFIPVRLVHSSVPLGLSRGLFGSLRGAPGVFGFIQVRLHYSHAHQVSYGSFGRTPQAVLLIRVRLVNSGAPRQPSNSFVHPHGSLGSFFCQFGRDPGMVRFIRLRLVHSDAPWASSASI